MTNTITRPQKIKNDEKWTYSGSGVDAAETSFLGLPTFFFKGGLPLLLQGTSEGTLFVTGTMRGAATIGESAVFLTREENAFSHAAKKSYSIH